MPVRLLIAPRRIDHGREAVIITIEQGDLVHQGARPVAAQDAVAGQPQRRTGQQGRAIGLAMLAVPQPGDDGALGILTGKPALLRVPRPGGNRRRDLGRRQSLRLERRSAYGAVQGQAQRDSV
jgi:hypothetical protein